MAEAMEGYPFDVLLLEVSADLLDECERLAAGVVRAGDLADHPMPNTYKILARLRGEDEADKLCSCTTYCEPRGLAEGTVCKESLSCQESDHGECAHG